LSSFLDSGHTTLIRWSDDGRSFIVLDEDEFARTLIPELFKHNNYASFVRQLNMYGFHKTVNITDGSLRQSEKARKGVKPPSMYSHPYFRRNRPDLLWLIQKPASKTGAKRKRDGTVKADDSDDERSFSPVPESRPPGELGMAGAGSDLAPLPRNEMSAVRRELQKLQQHQKYISDMITQLKQQNDTFYRQATAFQALHDRHENSINAILTFLATFYNRSMEGQAGQNLVNMFSNMAAQQGGQQTGSVVEDFTEAVPENNNTMQRFKRPQLLLPAPTVAPVPQFQGLPGMPGMAQTAPNSARTSTSPINGDRNTRPASARPASSQPPPHTASTSPQVKNDAPTPDMLGSVPDSGQMMDLINGVNATNATSPGTAAPSFDFTSALDHYQNANGNSPLTPQQRDDMLAMISNSQGGPNNNALVSPTPPAMPDMNQFRETQKQLEILTNLQKSQDSKVHELSRRLQPLSPTGTIPGVADANEGGGFFDPTGAPGEFDPNSFINFDNENDLNFNFDNDDGQIDWDFGSSANPASANNTYQNNLDQADSSMLQPEQPMDGGGRVESVSSGATSPAVDEYGTPGKRPRLS
jgi:heat shock transcription factor